jgi:hypothetical protein
MIKTILRQIVARVILNFDLKATKKLLASLFLCLTFNNFYAQKIFAVNYKSQSDIKVFVVNYESQADLKVFKVGYKIQAKGNDGLWYFVDYKSQGDKNIYFVDYKSQADLKIYFVDFKSRAGWRNNKKKHLLY